MKTTEQLINNLIGQLNGINKMMEKKADCFKILTQMKAVKAGMGKVMEKFSEDKLLQCVKGVKKSDQEKIKKLLAEINNS